MISPKVCFAGAASHGVFVTLVSALLCLPATRSPAQALLCGRVIGERWPGSKESFPYSAILCFDTLAGSGHESKGFRTWETEPPGWFRFSTDAGRHTLVFTGPNHFLRPIVLNNVFVRPGERVESFRLAPRLDFTNFFEGAWDSKPATDYFQTFIARGRSVTSVGFRLATDGVDGAGPKSQDLVVTIHRYAAGTPEAWPQVGPAALVPEVDCGGPKNYLWCAGWNSGEVPLTPGETYAVRLRAAKPGGAFQAFWRRDDDRAADCYRMGAGSTGWQGHDLWLAVATDGEGLLIPYNKRVQKQFGEFAGFASKWSQTWVAQGRSLAAVVLYAAVGGAQPPLSRQRLAVRVRRGGPDGAVLGLDKIAIGNGNYTGDASWGAFGVAFAPGEVPLTPGETFAVEFESLENATTLEGFVNIKGQVSDGRPGFNPYRKVAPDTYEAGTAFKQGHTAMPFDLDLQIIEYEFTATNWPRATDGPNLLANPGLEEFSAGPDGGPNLTAPPPGQSGYRVRRVSRAAAPARWKPFVLEPGARHAVMSEDGASTNLFASVFAEPGRRADGGFVRRVDGLSRTETYRLSARVRASWAVDFEHQCWIGLDPTGQESDPHAASIQWSLLPGQHGAWTEIVSEPARPTTNALSVWLRARSTWTGDTYAPFIADFDDLTLRRVRTEPPDGR